MPYLTNVLQFRASLFPGKLIALVASVMCVLAGNAAAFEMTREEYDLLPSYCRSLGNTSPPHYVPQDNEQARAVLGPNSVHVHHYCWGLVSLGRAYRPGQTKEKKSLLFAEAIQNFHYSIERATSDFYLLPEILTKTGEAHIGRQDDKSAEISFKAAIKINKNYWPAYIWWSQRYLFHGNYREALAIAEQGRTNCPDSKAIIKLISDIKAAQKSAGAKP